MGLSILLLAVLFIAGFINIFFYFPTKKFHAWIRSFIKSRPSAVVTTASSNPQVVSSSSIEERSAYKRAELKRVFATFDKDGDEFITQEELRESLKNLRLSVTEKEVEEMVMKVDTNGDGLIDLDEFCMLYGTMVVGHNHFQDGIVDEGGGGEEDLKEAFDVFDKDQDGLISVEELGFVLSSLGLNEGKKIENCKEMIRKVDTDGDGMVNFDEFKRMMKNGGLLAAF